jgi:hypothetical protein
MVNYELGVVFVLRGYVSTSDIKPKAIHPSMGNYTHKH